MDDACRSSRATEASNASMAGWIFVFFSASRTSASSSVSIHLTTCSIVLRSEAAANSTGARSFVAAAYQKSPSERPRLFGAAPSASHAAVRRAPAHVVQPARGVHEEDSRPVELAGSNSWTVP